MKKKIMLVLMAFAQSGAWADDSPSRVGDFALIDNRGDFHQMESYKDRRAVVMLSSSTNCAADADAIENFRQLQARFTGEDVAFMLLNADGTTDRKQVSARIQEFGLDSVALMDDSQLVSETLGVQRSSEFLVYDPDNFSLIYRGQDADAVARKLNGSPERIQNSADSHTQFAGCSIEYKSYATRGEVPSYSEDVAPILAENCATCHRDGGIAPFAMDSHLMVQGWSPMMRETLMTKRMPPGQIDQHIGNFDALDLSNEEIQTLVHWIDAGSPKDGMEDPLTQLAWDQSRWPLGEPDLIVKIPASEIPASGTVPYVWVDSGVVIPEDRWVRGAQLLPGDPTVVHHIISLAVPPELEGPRIGICPNPCATGEQSANQEGVRLQGYAPGINPSLMSDDTGVLVKADSRMLFQMHYTTSGKETTDASEFGLYFHPKGFEPSNRRIQAAALDNKFVIPPHAENFPVSNSFQVPVDAVLTSFTPHMHVRGKSMRFTAKYPDGSEEALLSVPHYDFNWQRSYSFDTPKQIPAGTTILVEGTFDNSEKNGANPAPDESVKWGDQSWEEMFIGFIGLEVSQR